MDYLLSTTNLTKQFGKNKAVNSVCLHVRQGDIYGLIGRNGAGKTTFLKMAGGLSAPTEGEITLFGKSGKEAKPFFSRIGLLIEAPGVYPNMTAQQNLTIKCIAMGVRDKATPAKLLQTVGLADVGSKKVKNFSLGMKQRLGIALALVGDPDLLLLDEPINGLDPQGIVEMREMLVRLNRGASGRVLQAHRALFPSEEALPCRKMPAHRHIRLCQGHPLSYCLYQCCLQL